MEKEARRTRWKQDPDSVKADILRAAVAEFSVKGLSGTRIDEIARRTATSKRMIYYYFGDKVGLYRAALESEYHRARHQEGEIDFSGLDAVEAMRRLVEFTFDFHRHHPEFVAMIAHENTQAAVHLAESEVIRRLNQGAVNQVGEIYADGVARGQFRPGLEPVRLHWMISALCFYNVSNRHTFSAGFGDTIHSDEGQETHRRFVVDLVMRAVMAQPEATSTAP
ncbi:TetR/AcrR family transcriptional regulator [Tropicimonas isoalkanivorans]|uniref:Transcriptional regulator, TetR family n=1 Tax=Tropicimonas isoalkanivorans TaxID=441112 RepID=A0A1I1QCS6_9RHOB|nr:TetR/AcrR family transcriptional regulator [Tropicimonas isoalkanivorans]SFD17628.1 transcriptional regulator, TetR family [Tropicimonas isoalkanivorans]